MVFGHQLPAEPPPAARFEPLLLPALVPALSRPKRVAQKYAMGFTGAYEPCSNAHAWPPETRNRHARGVAVAQLARLLASDHCLFEPRYDWRAREPERQNLLDRYITELDETTIVFSPPGFGYQTYRNSDAWARGRLLFAPALNEILAIPEPALWAKERIAVTYSLDGGDLADKALWATAHADELQDRASRASATTSCWGPAERQVRNVAAVAARPLATQLTHRSFATSRRSAARSPGPQTTGCCGSKLR